MRLDEISQEYARKAHKIAEEVEPRYLPFDDLFNGNRWRTLVDFPPRLDSNSTIGELIDFFERNEHEISLTDGTTSYQYEIPAGPKEGELTSSTSKLGKRLNGLESFAETFEELLEEAMKEGEMLERVENSIKTNYNKLQKVYSNLDSALYKIAPFNRSPFLQMYNEAVTSTPLPEPTDLAVMKKSLNWIQDKAQEWQEYWNANSKEIINNPNSVKKQYKIILTRHPIDILRMSDIGNIDSCLREGGAQFKGILRAEMNTNGAAAYLVEQSEIEQVDDLQKDEIFRDERRNVPGIEAIARMRLRRLINLEDATELALPVRSIYGKSVPGFGQEVIDYARKKQRDKINHIYEEHTEDKYGEGKYLPMDKFGLWGASYMDKRSNRALRNFMDKENLSVEGSFAIKGEAGKFEDRFKWKKKKEQLQGKVKEYIQNIPHFAESEVKIIDMPDQSANESGKFFRFSTQITANFEDEPRLALDVEHSLPHPNANVLPLSHISSHTNKRFQPINFYHILAEIVENFEETGTVSYMISSSAFSGRFTRHFRSPEDKFEVSAFNVSFNADTRIVVSEKPEEHMEVMSDKIDEVANILKSGELIADAFKKKLQDVGFLQKETKQSQNLSNILDHEKNPFKNFKIHGSGDNIKKIVVQRGGTDKQKIGTTFTELNFEKIEEGFDLKNKFLKKLAQIYEDALDYTRKQLQIDAGSDDLGYEEAYDILQKISSEPLDVLRELTGVRFERQDDAAKGKKVPVVATIYFMIFKNKKQQLNKALIYILEYFDNHIEEVINAANEALQHANKQALEAARSRGEAPNIVAEGNTPVDNTMPSKRQLADLVGEVIFEEEDRYGRG